jgi:predicted ATPase
MKIQSITINGFRRFQSLSIPDIPAAKLVILAGPNGSGKSSLFDAFATWHSNSSQLGHSWDTNYHGRDKAILHWQNQVNVILDKTVEKKSFYLRSAYRNETEFELTGLSKLPDPSQRQQVRRMIDPDAAVSQNYQRLAANAFEDVFDKLDGSESIASFREGAVGEIGRAVQRLFPDLILNTLGNPLADGTFRFTKGTATAFSYKNLSGGEKAAFDLLLDILVKRRSFDDTVFGIDEPETHINSRLQGALLQELFELIPDGSQMWIATHSIGMMRKARELYSAHPNDVIFFDFEGHNFDEEVVLRPVAPTRKFWERILKVALDDLAELLAPKQLIICEGNPSSAVPGKNDAHDAQCYDTIFSAQYPDSKFISGGNSKDVSGDRLRFAHAFPNVIPGIEVRRLIDRDDHAAGDVANFKADGVRVLRRRHLECYLYDEEVLLALYEQQGRSADFTALKAERTKALSESVNRGNPADDVKSATPAIYVFVKKHLGLTACGDDQMAFARNILAPIVTPTMNVYKELQADIFG